MVNLIKNYIPIRVTLPPIDTTSSSDSDNTTIPYETFLYVKKHASSSPSSDGGNEPSSTRTLFVTNAPFYPYIRTSILLKALFEKYGDVEDVVVAPKPRKVIPSSDNNTGGSGGGVVDEETVLREMFERGIRGGGEGGMYYGMALDEDEWYQQGRFAHVRFTDGKQLRNALGLLTGESQEKSKKKKKKKKNDKGGEGEEEGNDDEPNHVRFQKLELQELQEISIAQFRNESAKFGSLNTNNDEDESSSSDSNDTQSPTTSSPKDALQALVEYHKNQIPPRALLQRIANNIVSSYETSEAQAEQKQQEAKEGVPDEDGFVTVSYKAVVGDKVAMERNGTLERVSGEEEEGRRRKGGKRRRAGVSKRARESEDEGDGGKAKGSDELKDFYRFQLRENKKRGMEELKSRFEEDLKRVKRMKEEKMFRPF